MHPQARSLTKTFRIPHTSSCGKTPYAVPWNLLYSGPHKVITRSDKTFKIIVRGRQITVSADRVKPAYLLEESQHNTGNPPNHPNNIPAIPNNIPAIPDATPQPRTTRSGRKVRLPVRFST